MSKKNKKDREIVKFDKEDSYDLYDLIGGDGPFTINGETYLFVDDYPSHGDGECHNVILLRQKDEKHFKFEWQYYRDEYYHENELEEVFPEKKVTVKYK